MHKKESGRVKQYQLSFDSAAESSVLFRELREKMGAEVQNKLLFQLFFGSMDRDEADLIAEELKKEFPDAFYVGCSTCGSIHHGTLCTKTYSVTCTVFESELAMVGVKQYRLGSENVGQVIREVVQYANENLWVKAIMLYTTVWETSMSRLCEELDSVRGDVQILGGGAFNEAIDSSSSFVLSNGVSAADNSIVFAFIGGDEFSLSTRYISGWKPLGKEMEITRAEGNILKEIEGVSAFETYRRYLKIENDETFLYNTLEFPYTIRSYGIEILRHPHQCLADGSLVMASDVETASKIRLAYGDPVAIMENVFKNVQEIRKEEPDVIAIFSCAGRKSFWGDDEIGNETKPFESIAPSAGFYTLSEFLRTGEHVNQHNLTLVIGSMKEMIAGREKKALADPGIQGNSQRRISTVERLANFIEEATRELEVANEQLSDMNQKLSDMAITDGMTHLYNRAEIQRRICEVADNEDSAEASAIMLDIDDFKRINDTYGHKEGDEVICTLANVMMGHTKEYESGSAGRWGGEEFMIFLPGVDEDEAAKVAESIREEFHAVEFKGAGHSSVSIGVVHRLDGESGDSLVMRADRALYKAKREGKNRTVRL